MEDKLCDVRIEGHQVSGLSGSTQTKSQDTNVYAKGIFDIEWESKTLESGDLVIQQMMLETTMVTLGFLQCPKVWRTTSGK